MDQRFYETYWSGETAPPDGDPTTPARKAKLARALQRLPRTEKVLDMGCGRGEFTAFLAGLGFAAVGVDIAAAAVDSALRVHPQLRFEVLKAGGIIPAANAEFGAVWSSEVIEHLFDVHAHLAEINRVLRPGGLLVLTTPFHGRLKNLLIALTKFDRHFDPELSHIRFFDRAGLMRCLTRAGFVPRTWSGIGRMWPLYRSWFVIAAKVRDPGPPPPLGG